MFRYVTRRMFRAKSVITEIKRRKITAKEKKSEGKRRRGKMERRKRKEGGRNLNFSQVSDDLKVWVETFLRTNLNLF